MDLIIEPGVTYLISYPKCGRTWIRVMLARAAQLIGKDPRKREIVQYRHEDTGTAANIKRKPYWKIESDNKERWSNNHIIFLVRDPRDVLVSLYFHMTKREKVDLGMTMSEFIRDDSWGIRSIVEFYNIWHEHRETPKKLLLLRYEDMHGDCNKELGRLLDFIEIAYDEAMLKDVVSFASFESMRKIELEKRDRTILSTGGLRSSRRQHPEGYKTRKGKVGGHIDYLAPEDIQYLNQQIDEHLVGYDYYRSGCCS